MPDPLLERVDATTHGDPHFYFISPLVPFNGGLTTFERRAFEDLTALLTSTGATEPTSLPVVKNFNRAFYEARWDAPAEASEATVVVWLADKSLGSLDLKAATTQEQIREVRAAGYAPFTPGRRLQIRFRVEVGAGEGVYPEGPQVFDGRLPTGDPRLFFAPPVTQRRYVVGRLDPGVVDHLAVEVWAFRNGEPADLVKRFAPENAHPDERVRLSRNAGFYQAIWPTDGVKPWVDYRAIVFLDGEELGWVNIDVTPLDRYGSGWPYELAFFKKAKRAGLYAVLAGNEAFIRFRIEDWLSFSFVDPLEDHLQLRPVRRLNPPSGVIDVTRLDFRFSPVTGQWEYLLSTSPATPISGGFRVNILLYNPDAGGTAQDPSFFDGGVRRLFTTNPRHLLRLSGTNPRLRSWDVGDRVAPCHGETFEELGPCQGSLGLPDGVRGFSTGVVSFGDVWPTGDEIGRDSFRSAPPAVIHR